MKQEMLIGLKLTLQTQFLTFYLKDAQLLKNTLKWVFKPDSLWVSVFIFETSWIEYTIGTKSVSNPQ